MADTERNNGVTHREVLASVSTVVNCVDSIRAWE